MALDWVPIVSSVSGAVIALAGTLAAGVRTDRSQRGRDRETERLKTYVDFAVVLERTHAALREVARREDLPAEERHTAAGAAVRQTDLYHVRERLLLSATTELVQAGETAFLRLIAMRDAVRAGARLAGPEYHAVYHPYAEALWAFRVLSRRELGQHTLTPEALGRADWSERADCEHCAAA